MTERVIPASMQPTYDRFHFAPAVKIENLILLSGQIGTDSDGRCPSDATQQFRYAFNHVEAILNEAGGGLSNIIEMTSFHVDMASHMSAFMKVKDEMISEPYPAWTAIGCTELAMPGGLVEIRVQAVIS